MRSRKGREEAQLVTSCCHAGVASGVSWGFSRIPRLWTVKVCSSTDEQPVEHQAKYFRVRVRVNTSSPFPVNNMSPRWKQFITLQLRGFARTIIEKMWQDSKRFANSARHGIAWIFGWSTLTVTISSIIGIPLAVGGLLGMLLPSFSSLRGSGFRYRCPSLRLSPSGKISPAATL